MVIKLVEKHTAGQGLGELRFPTVPEGRVCGDLREVKRGRRPAAGRVPVDA